MIDTCVCCGGYVPEDSMVCQTCQKRAEEQTPKSFKRITRETIMGDYGSNEVYADPYEEIQVLRNALGRYEDLGYTPNQLKEILAGDGKHG